MVKRVKWTKEEDEILVQAIKANPHNKQEAFRKASEEIGRSAKCCSNRWYQALSNPEHKAYVGCIVTMISRASNLDNRTINRDYTHITSKKTKKNLWAKVKALFGL